MKIRAMNRIPTKEDRYPYGTLIRAILPRDKKCVCPADNDLFDLMPLMTCQRDYHPTGKVYFQASRDEDSPQWQLTAIEMFGNE